MRICLDVADPSSTATGDRRGNGGGGGSAAAAAAVEAADAGSGGREVEGTGFSLVLDERWRGTSSTPSMKMV